jgi:protein tyrosine/serine phosphatase
MDMLRGKSGRRLFSLALAVAVVAALGRIYLVNIRPNLVLKRFGVVDPQKVYRSGQLTVAGFNELHEKYGIKTIIDLGSTIHSDPVGERRNQRTADALGIKRYVMYLYGDSTGNPNYYIQALRLASDPANQPVLVHCGAGTERTGLFSLLYRAEHLHVPVEEGFKEAQAYGHNAKRTPQVRQMMDTYARAILDHYEHGGQISDGQIKPLPDPVPGSPLDNRTPLQAALPR